uniref:Ig-like domain-containing protein n=1 Tax=Seriola dumerili TaxID=41447 RepID=A0A3B4TDN7_SERDU
MSNFSRALDGTNSPCLVCSMSLYGQKLPKDQNCYSHASLAYGSVDRKLECKVTGSPVISFKWFKDEMEISSTGTVHLFFITTQLTGPLPFVQLSQAMTSSSLPEPPCILEKPESMNVLPGSKVLFNFQCIVAGSPNLSVQWQKDENWILEDAKIERTFENNVATLRIPVCEATHSGRYSCQVVNEAGQDKCFATLTVQGILVLS